MSAEEKAALDGPGEWRVRDHRYEVVIASSVEREGIAVEVWDAEDPTAATLFEVFHHDPSQSRSLTVWTERELPVELVLGALRLAEQLLRRPTHGRLTRALVGALPDGPA